MVEEYDDELERLKQELDSMDDTEEDIVPESKPKDSIFRFFREIMYLKDSRKIGNLHDTEIGKSRLTVRSYLELAELCKVLNWDKVSNYLSTKAEICLSTSLSRKGFLPQLFVTQIKREQKLDKPKEQVKKKWWGTPKTPSEEG